MRLTFATVFVVVVVTLAAAPARPQGSANSGSTAAGQFAVPAAQATGKAANGSRQKARAAKGGAPAASKGRPVKLSEVVVTATRIKQPLSEIGTSVSVMAGSQMQDEKLALIAPAMQQLPGVEVNQAGSPGTQTDVTIRGSTAAQTLVLIDGVDVNTASTGGFDFSGITTDNIEQVEVVRGSGGALYGSQAIGGVVNVISKQGQGAPHFGLLSEGGNRGTERQVFTANGAQGDLAYSGSISYQSTEGFRPINDSSDSLSGALRLDYHLDSDTTVRGFARYIRSNVGLVNFSNSVGELLDPNAHQRGEFMLYKGEVEHNFTDRLWAKWSVFYVRNEIRLNNYPEPANLAYEVDDIPDENRAAQAQAVYTWDWGRSVAGFDFHDQWARIRDNFVLPPPSGFTSFTDFHHQRQEYAGYVEQEETLPGGLATITGGSRVDGNSDFGEEVSPAWSVVVPVKKISATLRGSYSEGFRAPSFDELYFPGFGNPNLQPEISSEYDGGVTKNFSEAATVSVVYFTRRIHNLIVPVPCAPVGTPQCQFGSIAGNAGRVDTQGVEFIPALSPWHGIGLSGNFTYLDETHRSAQSASMPLRTPKYSASATLHFAHNELIRAADAVNADFVYVFVGDRDDVSPMGTILDNPAYHLFNLTVNYSPGFRWNLIRSEQVYVRVQNMFDRRYQALLGFKSPPVNFVAGVTMGF
jgi:vitamin B12 transporter